MRSFLLFCLFGLLLPNADAIAQRGGEASTIQPTIIVIPYAKDTQDLRTVLEENIATRVAIAKVKEGFDDRGFTTVDFVATLKALSVDIVMTGSDQASIKSALVEASRADIYVEVEAYEEAGTGGASSARIIMTAYDAFTARSLGTKTSTSMESRAPYTALVENALSRKDKTTQVDLIQDFLNTMQEKFDDIVENGRAIKVIFTLHQDAMFNFDSESSGGDYLSEEIEYWLDDNAYKGNFSEPRVVDERCIIDEVRIPLKRDNGRAYRPSRFAREIRKWIETLNLPDAGAPIQVDQSIRGGTLYMSLS